MTTLADYQSALLTALFTDQPERALCALEAYLEPGQERGLDIYRRNVAYGVVGRLEQDFSACMAILGHRNFRYLARQFMLKHPPNSRDIRAIGGRFAAFLNTRAELEQVPFVADLARLEWIVAAVLRSSPTEQDRPSFTSNFPVAAIWNQHRAGRLGRTPIESSNAPTEVSVWLCPDSGAVLVE